jgi:hypothetical protein
MRGQVDEVGDGGLAVEVDVAHAGGADEDVEIAVGVGHLGEAELGGAAVGGQAGVIDAIAGICDGILEWRRRAKSWRRQIGGINMNRAELACAGGGVEVEALRAGIAGGEPILRQRLVGVGNDAAAAPLILTARFAEAAVPAVAAAP